MDSGRKYRVGIIGTGLKGVQHAQAFAQNPAAEVVAGADGIDFVVGAKGSPLQLILSSVYHIDSPTRRVDAWDFDNATGAISNRRTAVEVQDKGAFPDGMAMDMEGKIWVALWGGWSVVRFDPETGEELARVELPVSQVSACAFGGPNLDELYITSARKKLTSNELENQPLAGGLFKARVAVRGVESVAFAG